MKNLLIYINPSHRFDEESEIMARIQIDNSLDLGWKDIVLLTNFPYEYNGIKAIEIGDDNYCPGFKQASKINSILDKFDLWDDIIWFHDFDAFQTLPIDINLKGDLGITDYGYTDYWNTGSFFFKKESRDIFELIQKIMPSVSYQEERAVRVILGKDTPVRSGSPEIVNGMDLPEIANRIEHINNSYNFPGSYSSFKFLEKVVRRTDFPVKVVHFHPLRNDKAFFKLMSGENKLNMNFIPNRLMKIIRRHL